MEEERKSALRLKIEQEILSLQKQMCDLDERAQTVDLDQPIGRLSRMDSLANQSISINARDKARARLARLERALTRIEDEGFGHCSICGEPIVFARLLAIPEASLCIYCAE